MRIKGFNDRVAMLGTEWFGSMGAFWVFFVWGLLGILPWIPANWKEIILLVSSAWIQLWALPLLAVGAAVLSRSGERRAAQDHRMLMEELTALREMKAEHEAILAKLEALESLVKGLNRRDN